MDTLGAMEKFVLNDTCPERVRQQIVCGFVLACTFGALRFEDARNIDPHQLHSQPDGLYGVLWRTKTRRRRGLKFMIPRASLGSADWLTRWETLMSIHHPKEDSSRWLCRYYLRNNLVSVDHCRDLDYTEFLLVFRSCVAAALEMHQTHTMKQAYREVNNLTLQSMRETFAQAHVQRTEEQRLIALQGHWPEGQSRFALQYARDRRLIPLHMVRALTTQATHTWRPPVCDTEVVDSGSDAEHETYYRAGAASPLLDKNWLVRYHVASSRRPARSACGNWSLNQLHNVGPAAPGRWLLCKSCARARPEITPAE